MTSKISERSFKTRVLRDLKQMPNCWVIKTQEVARRGVPDILMCLRGKFIGIELKQQGKKPDALQSHTLGAIVKAGGVGFCATPDMWDHHLEMLRGL